VSTRRRSALALILLASLAGGCGQQQSSQRPAVADYIKQVNTIEAALATPLASVTSAGNAFSEEQRSAGADVSSHGRRSTGILTLGPSPEQTLQKAWIEIRALRTRLAAITTPPAAGRLRALLLELIDGQTAMTRQIAELVAFLPHYTATLASLGPATKRLETALNQRTAYGAAAVSAVFASKAAALRQFQATTAAMVMQLRRLQPPAVSQPGYNAQVKALQGMGTSAGRLAEALASGATSNVGPVLAQFDRALASTNTIAVQKAEIAAARAYDSRVSALDVLSQKVALERLRLSDALH
jgi:hypothetical protein